MLCWEVKMVISKGMLKKENIREKSPRGLFLESPGNFSGRESYLRCCVFIQDQSFNNFDNHTMKLSLNEAKLTVLWARNWTAIQQVLILIFALEPRKVAGSLEKRAPGPKRLEKNSNQTRHFCSLFFFFFC